MEAINLFVQAPPELKIMVEEALQTNSIRHFTTNYEAGDSLFEKGLETRNTFFIHKGLVRLYSTTPDGYSKTIFIHTPGSLVGFQYFQDLPSTQANSELSPTASLSVLDQPLEAKAQIDCRPSILNAQTMTKATITVINAQDFARYMKSDGEACFIMGKYLFWQLSNQTREAVNASLFSVLQRFAALLLKLTAFNSGGNNDAPESSFIPFSNTDLAEMLGVHVNSITNSISSLRKAGCIDKYRGALMIVDREKLQSYASGLV